MTLVDELARATIGSTFNFYRDGDRAPLLRARLAAYLEARADASIVLVGEAPGYRGTRVSGVPFTSERQLTGNGPGEATATVVHAALRELDLFDDVLLWNAVPTHPHVLGRPETNRSPTRGEVGASRRFLAALACGRRAVAVGRVAQAAIGGDYVRHPSHGGTFAFREGVRRILR